MQVIRKMKIEYYKKAIAIYHKLGMETDTADTYNNMGDQHVIRKMNK